MVPVGYMAKRVTGRPDWIAAGRITDIYSVSGCVSPNFADYVSYWRHNGYWFFDSPQTIVDLAREHAIGLGGTTLFFYEAYELEFDGEKSQWTPVSPEPSFETGVVAPAEKSLEGYDVVTFSVRTAAECSPLSCNSLALEVETNRHCLLPSLERAVDALEMGAFRNAEPGPYRIFAVHSVEWPWCPEREAR